MSNDLNYNVAVLTGWL